MSDINIVLFLSEYKMPKSEENPRGAKEEIYTLDGSNRSFIGIQTNDAPIEYLFTQAKAKQAWIKRVICITSLKVRTVPEDRPQLDRFKDFVKDLSAKYDMQKEPEVVSIPYDFDESSLSIVDYGNRLPGIIYDALSTCFQTITPEEEVYIDYTGGLRDISFLMTSIIKFLEYKGLTCGEIVYSNFYDKKLYDIHYIYDIYQMINGVNEFTSTGNARELQRAYKNIGNTPAENVIDHLISFSDALSICAIGDIDKRVDELIAAIDQLENSSGDDINSIMLKTLTPTIKKKMYLDKGLDYPNMIRWCTENNMIQQAATIYTDKMPKYYFDNSMVPDYVNIDSIIPIPGHSKYDIGFYTELYDRAAEGLEVADFRKSLKSISLELNGTMNRAEIVSELENKKKGTTGTIKAAYNRLIDFIKRCYEPNGIDKKQGTTSTIYRKLKYDPADSSADKDNYILVNGEIPSKFKNFWEALISSNNYWLHRFLYNKEEDYLAISAPSGRGTDKTFRRKLFGLQRIKDGRINLGPGYDNDTTAKIMAYYLAVKIMRNRMNHAGEGSRTNDEKEVIRDLNTFGITFSDDINSYRKILLDGITI